MSSGAGGERLWIVGSGRMGLSLGLLLRRSGALDEIHYSGRTGAPPAHPLFLRDSPPAGYQVGTGSLPGAITGVVVAVADDAIPEVVESLARLPLPGALPVLHLSGSRGLEVLDPLARAGCSVGALHPLCAVADPVEGARRLQGAAFGVEASGPAGALARRIVAAAGGTALGIAGPARADYHAAAVIASNYAVALLGLAERLMERAGLPAERVRPALTELAAGAIENVRGDGPSSALTGPVSRGDAEVVRLHLARLSGDERALYCLLGREALRLARSRLSPDAADRMEKLLGGSG